MDTISEFCGLGKLEAADLISKSTEAKSQAEFFTKPEMTKESLQENGNVSFLACTVYLDSNILTKLDISSSNN